MTGARVHGCTGALVLVCTGALVLVCTGALLATQQQPVFRTSADLVTVPVSVRASGTPVGGLKPEDFLILDNGVPQTVESLTGESVGADITILVETSQTMKKYLGSLSDQVKRISAMVRPDDRLEVLGIDTYLEELLPMRRAADQPPLGRIQPGGTLVSVNDALVAALLREPDKQRPHLVIAITDTVDSMSMTDMATVRDVAKESGATLVIAWVTMSLDTAEPLPGDPPPPWFTSAERASRAAGAMIAQVLPTDAPIRTGTGPSVGNGSSTVRGHSWVPHYTPPAGRILAAFDLLKEAAETTGGALHPPGVFTDRTAAAIFNKVYDDYRHSYVLRYMPTGVTREGWHDITVTTPKYSSYELRARRGYLVETKSPAVEKATNASLPVAPIDALVAAGESGDFNAVGQVIRSNTARLSLIDDFKKRGNVFPSAPRREFLVALQLAEAALPSTSLNLPSAGYALLERYRKLLPQVEGYDGFDRYWRAAALALAQAPARPTQTVKQLLADSLVRFPNEPRFVLAAAIFADQEWIVGDVTSGNAPTRRAADVIRLFDAAIALEPTRAEASVRKARFLDRMGRSAEALPLIESAKPDPQDAVLCYWRELFRGKILDNLGRPDEAAAAFRAALAIGPNAQSGRSALMAVLARSGHRAEAEAVAEELQNAPANGVDPWWTYWQADYRWFPTLFSHLAELAK